MQPQSHISQYIAAGIIMLILGGFGGWYLFVRQQVSNVTQTDAARGFDETPSFGSAIGSALSNLLGNDGFGSAGNLAPTTGKQAPRLWNISATPVSGFSFEASSTKLMYVERSSGNMLRANPAETTVERLTNTLFPKIYEALVARDGSVVLRSLSDTGVITSFAAKLATSSSPAAGDPPYVLSGVYLPQNISSIGAKGSSALTFVLQDPAGGSALITSDWKGGAQKRLLTSALSQWQLIAMNDGTLYLSQNPSDDVDTYSFTVRNNALAPFMHLPGLMLLPKENSPALLYSSSAGGTITLYARASAQAKEIALPIHTVARKCAWAPGSTLVAYCGVPQTQPRGAYLRSWLSGELHTIDALWKIDVSAGTAEQIYQPDPTNQLDMTDLMVSASGTHIGFINSRDASLWMYTI